MLHAADVIISRRLEPDEQLLWAGRPRLGVLLRPSDAFMIPFSLVWGGFAFVWEYLALSSEEPWFGLFGIPFVLAGWHLMVGRFIADARLRRTLFFGVSTRRIIVVSGDEGEDVISLPLASLREPQLTVRADGSGTIEFEEADRPSDAGACNLRDINDARAVYDAIRRARNAGM